MAKRALSWRRAAVIGWRDLNSAPAKFCFVILSVAVGVAALVGVRGFSESFRRTIETEARSLMAADLSVRLTQAPTAAEQSQIDAILNNHTHGANPIRSTWVTETISMASVPPDPMPLLISLKAVDPAQYPFYGQVELEPAMSLQQALTGNSAVVAEEFLIRMNSSVGQTLELNGQSFRITAILKQEPDRITSGPGMGPRVMISQASLTSIGLLAPGSRANHRLLLKIPAGVDSALLHRQFEQALPEAQVMNFREGNPSLNHGLENATAILSLICLVAMVLGAIGVAMAMHAHLEQRMNMLAILKAVGADSSDLLRIFLLQTLTLGLAGGLLGVAAGLGVMAALPTVFGKLMPVQAHLEFPWRSIAAGLGTGLLTTLLFCLPPLLDVRAVRPVLVLRRLVEQGPMGLRGWLASWWARRLQLGISVLVIAALGGVAWALSDSVLIGQRFAATFTIALIVLLALAGVALWVLRFTLNRVRLRLPSSLRHGLANLYRPGNQSAAVLAALGTGVMLILTVYLMQSALLRDLRETAAPSLPNVFLIDVSSDELAGVKNFFAHQSGVSQSIELMPVVRSRILSLNGQSVEPMQKKHSLRRLIDNTELSWADAPPGGYTVTQGVWWKNPSAAEIAVEESAAKQLHLQIGSPLEVEIDGAPRSLKVTALYHADGKHLGAWMEFVLPSGQLKNELATWYAGLRMDPKQVASMERALFAAYPTIVVINVASVLERVESLVDQVTFVVRFLAGFSIFAGLMILASSIAGTRFRRMREAVVMKTLGATRMRIVRTFSVEFSVLGLLAGAVGVVFANVLTRGLLHKLEVGFQLDWTAAIVALVGTAILATATGWLASYRILGLRPLEVLREE